MFIKLDISKAFDSIGWSFLLEVLQALGFSTKSRDWIADLLGTTTSKVLINGEPTQGISHGPCSLGGIWSNLEEFVRE